MEGYINECAFHGVIFWRKPSLHIEHFIDIILLCFSHSTLLAVKRKETFEAVPQQQELNYQAPPPPPVSITHKSAIWSTQTEASNKGTSIVSWQWLGTEGNFSVNSLLRQPQELFSFQAILAAELSHLQHFQHMLSARIRMSWNPLGTILKAHLGNTFFFFLFFPSLTTFIFLFPYFSFYFLPSLC